MVASSSVADGLAATVTIEAATELVEVVTKLSAA